MMESLHNRLVLWWEFQHEEWWADFKGVFVHAWWRFHDWRRSRNPELVELDAFRELIAVERQLADWPRAIPVLEKALKLYETTKQPVKREAVRKRLAAVDPDNSKIRK